VEQLDWFSMCKSLTFFQQLPEDIIKKILHEVEVERLEDEAVLFREGELDPSLYLVLSGKITVSVLKGGSQTEVFVLSSGDCIGARNLLEGSPRVSTAICALPSRVAKLTHSTYVKCLSRFGHLELPRHGLNFNKLFRTDRVVSVLERQSSRPTLSELSSIMQMLEQTTRRPIPPDYKALVSEWKLEDLDAVSQDEEIKFQHDMDSSQVNLSEPFHIPVALWLLQYLRGPHALSPTLRSELLADSMLHNCFEKEFKESDVIRQFRYLLPVDQAAICRHFAVCYLNPTQIVPTTRLLRNAAGKFVDEEVLFYLLGGSVSIHRCRSPNAMAKHERPPHPADAKFGGPCDGLITPGDCMGRNRLLRYLKDHASVEGLSDDEAAGPDEEAETGAVATNALVAPAAASSHVSGPPATSVPVEPSPKPRLTLTGRVSENLSTHQSESVGAMLTQSVGRAGPALEIPLRKLDVDSPRMSSFIPFPAETETEDADAALPLGAKNLDVNFYLRLGRFAASQHVQAKQRVAAENEKVRFGCTRNLCKVRALLTVPTR
jgi:CRP-like cAMP-binding protein